MRPAIKIINSCHFICSILLFAAGFRPKSFSFELPPTGGPEPDEINLSCECRNVASTNRAEKTIASEIMKKERHRFSVRRPESRRNLHMIDAGADGLKERDAE